VIRAIECLGMLWLGHRGIADAERCRQQRDWHGAELNEFEIRPALECIAS